MPKRKNSDIEEYINKKIRELEQKLKRKKRRRIVSSSSRSSASSRSSSPDSARRSETSDRNDQDTIADPAPVINKEVSQSEPDRPIPPPAEPIASTSADSLPVQPENAELELDANILEILGIDPTNPTTYGSNIQKDLAVRLEHLAVQGLPNSDRKNFLDKHLIPDNCRLIGAPALNPELKGALSDFMLKRDKTMEAHQRVTAAAISSLAQALTSLMSAKEKNTEMLSTLMDTIRLLCDRQNTDSKTRRGFIINHVKKEMRDSLENAKADSFLFGHNLAETLKTAKAVNKTSSELVVKEVPEAVSSKKTAPKNWKTSHAARKPHATETSRTKDTPATSTKNQRTSSYKRSSNRRSQQSRR